MRKRPEQAELNKALSELAYRHNTLADRLRPLDGLTSKMVRMIDARLSALARSRRTGSGKANPQYMSSVLSSGIASRAITTRNLRRSADLLTKTLLRLDYYSIPKARDLSEHLDSLFGAGSVRPGDWDVIASLLQGMAYKRWDPAPLASEFARGFNAHTLDHKVLEAMEGPLKAGIRTRHNPSDLMWRVNNWLEAKHIDASILKQLAPVLELDATLPQSTGDRPHLLLSVLGQHLREGNLDRHRLTALLPFMRASAGRGEDPAEMLHHIVSAIGERQLTDQELNHLVKHLPPHKEGMSSRLFQHAMNAKAELGIPLSEVIAHQEVFLNKGHFPTANAVIDYHRRVVEKRGNKREEMKR